jgi:hypothetical protein
MTREVFWYTPVEGISEEERKAKVTSNIGSKRRKLTLSKNSATSFPACQDKTVRGSGSTLLP